MEYTSNHGTKITVCSPEEVIQFRKNRNTAKQWSFYSPIAPEILEKLTQIYITHGYRYEEYSMGLLLRVDSELLNNYSFTQGYVSEFGLSVFPEELLDRFELQVEAINYAVMILEAFGWVLTFDNSDDTFYKLIFAPLQAYTPEEVERIRLQKAKELAVNVLPEINTGLIKKKHYFSLDSLGFPIVDDIDLTILAIEELRKIMPSWEIDFDAKHLYFTPASS